MPSQLTPLEFEVPHIPDSIENEELREYLRDLNQRLEEHLRAVSQDMTQGRAMWPVLTDVDSTDTLPGSFCFEYDGTRRLVWARVDTAAPRILTNIPQGIHVELHGQIQNSAVGGWGVETWTFPLGGFAAGVVPTVGGFLEIPAAHWGRIHVVYCDMPTNTAVTFHIEEWDPIGLIPTACTSGGVWINATAIGRPA